MEERIRLIQQYTETAIHEMNDNYSFKDAKVSLEKAFELCSPSEDLAYYQIMATLLNDLQFRWRTIFRMMKIKKQYKLLFAYIDLKFSDIVNFRVDCENTEEADIMNTICCTVYNRMLCFYQAFHSAHTNAGLIWGLLGLGIGNLLVRKFMAHIRSVGKNMAIALRKYNSTNAQILQNIKEFAHEK